MYTAGDVGSLQAHNVANDEMQVFEANDEMQVFATNDEMQVFEANDEMQVFEEMSDHADTMHTSVATGATTATANTISSQDSRTDDSEAQSVPSQDIPCSTQVPYLILTFNSEEEARAHYNRKFSLKKFLRSHRAIPKEEKDFITMLHGVNISAGRIMKLMSELYGGARNVPYTRKDISNFKSKLGSEYRCRDIPEPIAHFEEIKKDDPNFFYKIQLDKEDRVQNIFWVDGAARNAYKDFKDCVSFDCTYMMNMYNMPCAPFIGINRHGQSIQLGCGFLRNEKTETFYKKIQEKITVATDQNEFEAEETIPSMWAYYLMKTKALEVYTRPIFNRFQKELIASTSYKLTRTSENMYLVEPNGGPVRNYGSKAFIVMTSDFVGQVSDIPEHYILPRWTMVKKPELPPVTSIGEQMQLPPESLKLIRYTNMCTKFTHIAKDASSNEKAYRMALQRTSSMTDDLAAMKQSRKKQKKAQPAPADPARGISDIPSASTNPTLQINDPSPSYKSKGDQFQQDASLGSM
ncbi:hypothetical protein OsI_30356 [Oryza sativa Indica Group]|uniref:MULE transposase domain-containing protein n=1 Tax=Oryza sativa subsp. indica TaxID=39946 RepID=B8BD06_ORYSI|nr:hypothetical protein OsI_30356 [Oryza sativa Indica Group]